MLEEIYQDSRVTHGAQDLGLRKNQNQAGERWLPKEGWAGFLLFLILSQPTRLPGPKMAARALTSNATPS